MSEVPSLLVCEKLPVKSATYLTPHRPAGRDQEQFYLTENTFLHYDMSHASTDDYENSSVWLDPQYGGKPIGTLQFRVAGPRKDLHFDPSTAVVGIVTCGGLCPGLNNVIEGIVMCALTQYNVKKVLGFRYGFYGLTPEGESYMLDLRPHDVRDIRTLGGSMLGTSRGGQSFEVMVDTLVRNHVSLLFTVGGEGTLKGASDIAKVIRRRGLDIAVIGVPKTIDNDVAFCQKPFGYETAVEEAARAVTAVRNETMSSFLGVGIVKVMGRHSGFIAAAATASMSSVAVCLIPEVTMTLDELFTLVASRLQRQTYCVLVVAEGLRGGLGRGIW